MAMGIILAHTAAAAGRDQEYNDWYRDVHVVDMLKLAGFTSARRFKRVDGEHDTPYLTVYEVEADDLNAALAGIAAAFQRGELEISDVLSMDPPPVMAVYEEI
jgi:hypothetical protein